MSNLGKNRVWGLAKTEGLARSPFNSEKQHGDEGAGAPVIQTARRGEEVNGSTGVCAGYDHIIGYLGAFTAVNNEGNAYKSNQARQPNPVRQLIQVIRSPARKNTTSITNIP